MRLALAGLALLVSVRAAAGERIEWRAASAERRVPVPAGWIVEPGAPSACAGLSNPAGAQVLQLEVIGPEQRGAYGRALLAAWTARVE